MKFSDDECVSWCRYDVLVPKNEGADNEIEADQLAAKDVKFDIGGTYVVVIQRSLTGTVSLHFPFRRVDDVMPVHNSSKKFKPGTS